MESSKSPGPSFSTPRRSLTAPVRPASPQSSPQSASELVDTLYDHPNVKIVSFTAGYRSLSVGPWTGTAPDIEPGSLSWTSHLERTIAAGAFRIYRAPGSVAFLSCGSALQPILPKSQVWCVDEDSSKFVLQIRRPQYWRIELPVEKEEDVYRAQLLRDVFDRILQFEKTECPFKRSFTVKLPERPQTPVKKRPWTPVRRSSTSFPLTPVTPVEIAPVYKGTPRGAISLGDMKTTADVKTTLRNEARALEPPVEEQASRSGDDSPVDADPADFPRRPDPVSVETLQCASPAASQQPTVAQPPGIKLSTDTLDSLHRRESWRSVPLPPSPPLSDEGSPTTSSRRETNQILSEIQVTLQDHSDPGSTSSSPLVSAAPSATTEPSPSIPKTAPEKPTTSQPPSPFTEDEEAFTTPASSPSPSPPSPAPPVDPAATTSSPAPTSARPSPLRRATTSSSISPSRSGPLSPFPPPAANLFAPRSPHHNHHHPSSPSNNNHNGNNHTNNSGALAVVRRLPMTVIHKTCEILMSPPSHLLSLMLKVAARIAAGEWRGLVFGLGRSGERVEVCWDWSDDYDYDDYGDVYDYHQDELRQPGHARRGFGCGLDPGNGYANSDGFGYGYGSGGGGNGRRGGHVLRTRASGGDLRAASSGFWRAGWGEEEGDGDDKANGNGNGWLRRRRMRERMAGSFPESSDDEEEQLGPSDVPAVKSPGRGPKGDHIDGEAEETTDEDVSGQRGNTAVPGTGAGMDQDSGVD